MIDTERMAVLHSVKQLEKYVFDEEVVSKIPTVMQYLREEVAVVGIVHNNVSEVALLDDAVEGDDVGVGGRNLMEGDFADVGLPLAGCLLQLGVHETLDGI